MCGCNKKFGEEGKRFESGGSAAGREGFFNDASRLNSCLVEKRKDEGMKRLESVKLGCTYFQLGYGEKVGSYSAVCVER